MRNPGHLLEDIVNIQPNNVFLRFIADRIQDPAYRGFHLSQHNRFDLERLLHILRGVHEVVGSREFRIPLGDDKGVQDPECEEYYRIVAAVKSCAGIGTVNSLKKNFFVDFQKMQLLDRFDKSGKPVGGRASVYSAKLTEKAIRMLTSSSIIERHKIFTDALDVLFGDSIAHWAETLYYSNYKNDPIGLYEFMFILSDDRLGHKNNKIQLIDSYRELQRWQQDKAIELIKEYCTPTNFHGSKTTQRDFGNWKNETQQIFTLLKNTVYFDITRSSLRLNTGVYGIFSETQIKRRSLGAKHDYFAQHAVSRMDRFELDHVVPFSAARNKVEFGLIDNWQNLIYLDKDTHAEKTRNRNKNVVLTANETRISLDDLERKHRIQAVNGTTAMYATKLAPGMQKYNRDILKEIFGYSEQR